MSDRKQAEPALFGLNNSNRDYSQRDAWGKNNFNSSFPTSLACYMQSKGQEAVYLVLDEEMKVQHKKKAFDEIFGVNPLDANAYYSFESTLVKYETAVTGNLPRIDLVVCKLVDGEPQQLSGLEIKLTALPDHTTAGSEENEYGSEIVVRPDTIVYLAISIANKFKTDKNKLTKLLKPVSDSIKNWEDASEVRPQMDKLITCLNSVLLEKIDEPKPLLLQPIWKTKGKTLDLEENCLDSFVWSDLALTRLFVDSINGGRNKISRQGRSLVWLIKMLLDYSNDGKFDHAHIIDTLTYDTKNDKAFAISGKITHGFMSSKELSKPRIKKNEIGKIILNGGQNYLSPERRFDAAVMSETGIFK